MMSDSEITDFEDAVHENGRSWWSARWLQERLGYASWPSFRAVLHRALSTCLNVGLDVSENFEPCKVDGHEDFKLSRFACFLICTVADGSKPAVEEVKAHLASIAAAALAVDADIVDRLKEREILSVGERLMSSAASRAGVHGPQLAMFKDAGYRGMYNMSMKRLKSYKGLDAKDSKKTLYDFMGVPELAANSFRVTQTAERLKRSDGTGVKYAEAVAKGVGREVREMMTSDGGTPPEDLELEEHISKGKSSLKRASRQMKKIDKSK